MCLYRCSLSFFFFNDTATTEIYTLSLHDALPIFVLLLTQGRRLLLQRAVLDVTRIARRRRRVGVVHDLPRPDVAVRVVVAEDRKSTRLNSSHANISYAVFCLKKKKIITSDHHIPH